jgi:hypothetical protein
MKTRLHLVAAIVAFLMILLFFTSTVVVEISGSREAIATVKRLIVFGLFILVPAIAVTGATGFLLSKSHAGDLVQAKKKRMPFIGANGLLVLVPAAIYLNHLSGAGDFGSGFVAIQSLELLAGATNLTLMGMNLRDGMRLTGRLR